LFLYTFLFYKKTFVKKKITLPNAIRVAYKDGEERGEVGDAVKRNLPFN